MTYRSTQESGGFGRGGQRPVALRFAFTGRLGPAFLEFARIRADRLDLRGWIAGEDDHAEAQIEGPEALVGAFEVACCIGPDNVAVEDWTSTETAVDQTLTGFEIRVGKGAGPSEGETR